MAAAALAISFSQPTHVMKVMAASAWLKAIG
jgi:hypothetical protein